MDNFSSISEQVLQFAPDALVVVDHQGIIRYANETTTAMFGHARDSLAGASLDLLVPERFRPRHRGHVSSFLQSPTHREMGARISDLYARRADGSEFPAAIRLAPFRSGNSSFVAAAIRDVTERRAIIDALIAAREEAVRANRAKSRFLATASHDLRQPLQTIRLLNASMLKMTQNNPALRDLLSRQELAIDGASRLLNSLLDISRLESGAIEPQLAAVELDDLLADLRHEFESAAAGKRLKFEFSTTHAVLTTDRVLIFQLFQNLIGNAVKYTERGYVRITHAMDADSLIVAVEDSGAGIPDDKLERIFDEYYQLGPQGTQRLGVGLGLAIVREVSRLLTYAVEVSSTVGKGTQVRVHIPRQVLLQQLQSPQNKLRGPAVVTERPAARLILLEDNDAVRAATVLFLSLEGYETLSAGSTAEAKAILSSIRPRDILVADYHLDGTLTGLDVLHQVRAHQQREVPAILLSGDLQSMMRVVKTPIARCRFLSKPVDTKALLDAIAELGASEACSAD